MLCDDGASLTFLSVLTFLTLQVVSPVLEVNWNLEGEDRAAVGVCHPLSLFQVGIFFFSQSVACLYLSNFLITLLTHSRFDAAPLSKQYTLCVTVSHHSSSPVKNVELRIVPYQVSHFPVVKLKSSCVLLTMTISR